MRLENPLLLLVLGIAAVLGMILPWLRQRLERWKRTLTDDPATPDALSLEPLPATPPPTQAWRRGEQRRQAAALWDGSAARPRRRRARLGSRNDLRQAIVLMTILGPCRALERDGKQP